jgi:2'-5' RNA ligase
LCRQNEPQKDTEGGVKEPATKWRMFCAVELSPGVREQLHEHIVQLRKAVPDATVSWSRVENIHLTLKFFGDVALDQIPSISEAATRAVKEFSSFQIGIGNTGVFPKPNRPQVLWIGVSDPSGKLSALQQRIENECEALGFQKEGRTYRPHLTIGRIRKLEGAKPLAEAHLEIPFPTAEITLKELVVFRSELSSKGSKYTPISRHSLF